MTTKKKCFDLAEKHGIEIYIHRNFFWEYSLSCPDGYQLEEFDGSRTGFSMCDLETKAELWKEVYSDLKTMLNYQPWPKVTDFQD
jgi:hypothetical protein